MIFCWGVYAFRVWLPSSITPALDDSRVSLQPAQSESENVVTSSTFLPLLNQAPQCLWVFKCATILFTLAKLCCVVFDIL